MTSRWHLSILLFLSLCLVAAAEDPVPVPADTTWLIGAEATHYCDNIESYNGYRLGEPWWGAFAQARISYRPHPRTTFSLGLHIRKDFGDSEFLSNYLPLFRMEYRNKGFDFVMGELYTRTQHGLIEPLLQRQRAFRPVVEEGMQFIWNREHASAEFWMLYPALNTAAHRERLGVGTHLYADAGPVRFSAMGYLSHYGGQLFSPPGEPVRANENGALGITFTQPLPCLVKEIGISGFILGSHYDDIGISQVRAHTEQDGIAGLGKIWCDIQGFKPALSLYQGENYTTWEGNPLFQSNEFYYFFELTKQVQMNRAVAFDFGLRLDFMGIAPQDWGAHADNEIWLVMTMDGLTKLR